MSSPEYAAYATKVPTETMLAFADFIELEVYGGTLPAGLDRETFVKSVALGGSLRMQFQKSEMWKSDPRNYLNGVESRRDAKAAEKAEKARESLRKATERAAKAEEAAKAAAEKAKARAFELAAKTDPTKEAEKKAALTASATEPTEPTPKPSAPKPSAPKGEARAA